MKAPGSRKPQHEGAKYLYATDNGWSADRYAVFLFDATALVVWASGSHSA